MASAATTTAAPADHANVAVPEAMDDERNWELSLILARKRRRRTSASERRFLEDQFLRNPRPDASQRKCMARTLSWSEKAIMVWYQNRRQKEKNLQRHAADQDGELSSHDASGSNAHLAGGSAAAAADTYMSPPCIVIPDVDYLRQQARNATAGAAMFAPTAQSNSTQGSASPSPLPSPPSHPMSSTLWRRPRTYSLHAHHHPYHGGHHALFGSPRSPLPMIHTSGWASSPMDLPSPTTSAPASPYARPPMLPRLPPVHHALGYLPRHQAIRAPTPPESTTQTTPPLGTPKAERRGEGQCRGSAQRALTPPSTPDMRDVADASDADGNDQEDDDDMSLATSPSDAGPMSPISLPSPLARCSSPPRTPLETLMAVCEAERETMKWGRR